VSVEVGERMHFPAVQFGRQTEILSPPNSLSEGLELVLIRPGRGDLYAGSSPGLETLLVILGGRCTIEVPGMGKWADLGERENVFGGPATCVYVPAGRTYTIGRTADAEIAVLRAPAPEGGDAFVVGPGDVTIAGRGKDRFRREVHTFLGEPRPAHALIVGETFNEPGGWSGYPPHKHDVDDPPREARLQEVYHFRIRPSQGFGIQRLYAPERGLEVSYTVHDGDSVLIPFGYHATAAAPGYRLYYLWALAGTGRKLHIREDPAHSWVAST
jgi:5-deoxy-glucuronate isomerase